MVSRTIVWRLITLAWAAEIFGMSTGTFGPDLSRSLLAGMLGLLHLAVSADALELLNTISRKLAHLTEYAVFSFLLYRSLGGQARIRWRPHAALWSIVAAAAYSLTDEFHQAFVPGRTASLIDCGIDATGAAFAMLLVYGGSWVLRKKTRNSTAQ